MKTLRSKIVVFEKKPRWTPELKRQFQSTGIHVRGVVGLTETMLQQPQADDALLVIVLEDAEEHCLQFLGRLAITTAAPPAIVVAGPETMNMEWTIRELGAADVVNDGVTGEEMAALCRHIGLRD